MYYLLSKETIRLQTILIVIMYSEIINLIGLTLTVFINEENRKMFMLI